MLKTRSEDHKVLVQQVPKPHSGESVGKLSTSRTYWRVVAENESSLTQWLSMPKMWEDEKEEKRRTTARDRIL